MNKLGLVTAFFFSLTASADFTGTWSGTGEAIDSTGGSQPCTKLEMVLTQKTDSFQRDSGSFDCGVLKAMLIAFQLGIQGNELWGNSSKLGQISEKEASAVLPTGPMKLELNLKRLDDKTLEYSEKINVGFGFVTLKGKLLKN